MASPSDQNRKLSPRKGLQGPKPSALKISKSSSKIKKQSGVAQDHSQAACPPPVIIYMKSPEVIHVDAQNFRSTVQHLTGNSSSSSSLPLPSSGDRVEYCSPSTSGMNPNHDTIIGSEGVGRHTTSEVDHMLLVQEMCSWGPPVPLLPPSSPTSLFPSPHLYPDFYDFPLISDTLSYHDSSNVQEFNDRSGS